MNPIFCKNIARVYVLVNLLLKKDVFLYFFCKYSCSVTLRKKNTTVGTITLSNFRKKHSLQIFLNSINYELSSFI